MIRRPVLVAVLATLVLLPGLVQAQPRLAVKPGIVLGDGTLILVDPARKEVTSSFPFPTNQAARGVAASGGFAYVGMWTDNGIQRVDLNNGKWETIVKDSTNQVLGAPYQPVIDNGAIGGPGLVVVDGNPPPAPFTGRNLATIDIRNRSFALDSVFPSIHLPMSDAFADPYIPDEIIGVGFSTSDQNVISIPISRKAQNVTPQVITRLKQPCLYDALIHENQKLYSWSSSPSFVGFECVDLDRLNSSQLIPVTGITHTGTGYGAWWNDPHENPGRKVFGVLDGNDTLYEVDLAQNPAPATAIKTTPGLPSSTYTTGRSIEEAELTSWRLGPGSRNFHLDFGPAHGGEIYILVPSLIGHGPPIVFPNGLEFHLTPDLTTILAVFNVLPGAPGKTVGTLDQNGEADVKFSQPGIYLPLIWKSAAFDKKGQPTNASPAIVVHHD